jgi:outer membrane biosynthesis protein TonB
VTGNQGAKKGYQPEARQTVIKGNISNRGRSSVAAEATPIGRYKKAVADAIGSRWYYYVQERMGLLSIGTVDVSFKVTSSGKVSGLRVVHSNSNESLTDCSLRSIMDAKLPPIPPDVAATLQNGCLEIDYSFTIY